MPRSSVLGIYQCKDFNGINVAHDPDDPKLSPTLRKLLKDGHFGIKTGRGWYDYAGRNPEDVIHKRDVELIRTFAACDNYFTNMI